ncbi:uncharacterized protein B0I36DRAFT_233310, partial [Microdochium trichocladiopsis]
VYVGESASLSLLETVRSALRVAVGPCAFTNESARDPMHESPPKTRFELAREPFLDLGLSHCLASQFFLAVSGILDLFDPPWLADQLEDCNQQSFRRSTSSSAVVYLALAIGAQGRAQSSVDEDLAEQCFAYGRQLVMFNLMNDPSLATVQAVMLITYYMMAACQHNAAFVNLGVAVRAAYTLGIHIHETNEAFDHEVGLARERAWKSLRVCDLFLAASLGRPPATSESVSNIAWLPIEPLQDGQRPGVAEQVFSAMFRICNIFERILVDVYSKKAVGLDLADSISQQHRQWTQELPRMLMVDGLDDLDKADAAGASPSNFGLSRFHGCGIVIMAYYYSIVLLTRPFLAFQVRQAAKRTAANPDDRSIQHVAMYADACVSSAVKGIDVAYEYVFGLITPKRQPLVVNSVFISALCLGLAHLDTFGPRKWPVDPSLDRAIKILEHLGELNIQSVRYARTCTQLKEAVTIHATRKKDRLLHQNERAFRSIFGDLRATERPRAFNGGSSAACTESPRQTNWACPTSETSETSTKPLTPSAFDFNSIQEQSMLPTLVNFPAQVSCQSHHYEDYGTELGEAAGEAAGEVAHQCPARTVVDFSAGHFLDLEVPLFPLINYTPPDTSFQSQ